MVHTVEDTKCSGDIFSLYLSKAELVPTHLSLQFVQGLVLHPSLLFVVLAVTPWFISPTHLLRSMRDMHTDSSLTSTGEYGSAFLKYQQLSIGHSQFMHGVGSILEYKKLHFWKFSCKTLLYLASWIYSVLNVFQQAERLWLCVETTHIWVVDKKALLDSDLLF